MLRTALALVLILLAQESSAADTRCHDAVHQLQKWYSRLEGVWDNCGFWNSANALNSVIDYLHRSGEKNQSLYDDIANSFERARPGDDCPHGDFITPYYDDEGWWALTWINAYDLTRNPAYLNMADVIFQNMTGAWDNVCGGGVWWNVYDDYKNAITNELFLLIAARLYTRTNNPDYLTWAMKEWRWFNSSGMINGQNLINDGIDENCQNNNGTTWTYNQGVILGALRELFTITGDYAYMDQAVNIATAALTYLTKNGILVEPSEPDLDHDQIQFKGIFMRNLYLLNQPEVFPQFTKALQVNADSIWDSARQGHSLGSMWTGPFDSADGGRQSSALDCLNAVCFG